MNVEQIFQQVMNENCPDPLHRFAELVAAAEREACAEHYLGIMRDAVEQAVSREREACAKIADNNRRNMQFLASEPPQSAAAWDIANKIRARGEK